MVWRETGGSSSSAHLGSEIGHAVVQRAQKVEIDGSHRGGHRELCRSAGANYNQVFAVELRGVPLRQLLLRRLDERHVAHQDARTVAWHQVRSASGRGP